MRTYLWETDESDEYATAGVVVVTARNLKTARKALLAEVRRRARKSYPKYVKHRRPYFPNDVRSLPDYIAEQIRCFKQQTGIWGKKPVVLKINQPLTFNMLRLG